MLVGMPKALPQLVLLLALAGCQDIRDARSGSTKAQSESPDRKAATEVVGDTNAQLAGLFRNEVAFTIPELTGGKTNCDDIVHAPNLADALVPWPGELKAFLLGELRQLPIKAQVVEAVFAIYLVRPEVLADEDGTAAAGLACDRGTDYKGIIFLNANTFLNDRKTKGIGSWQDLRSVQAQHVLLQSGDNAALTLFHEIMHAIDNKLFVNSLSDATRGQRAEIAALSWTDHTTPRYERISLLSLTGDEEDALLEGGCATRSKAAPPRAEAPPTLALAGQTGEQLAADLKLLAEKTNFIVPYTTVTAAEDWAETLTIYYYGMYRSSWQTRSVYRENIASTGLDGATLLYDHKTQDIIKTPLQRDKVCKMAELVFGACKL
jgi:hypothetical protein